MRKRDSRKYTRSKISIAAQLTPEGGEPIDIMVDDLSLHGMLVHAEQQLEVGQPCRVRILLGRFKHELPMIATGSVVRTQDEYLAIQFGSIGIEAHEELESMILSHSEDPVQCLKEFSQSELIFDPLSACDLNPSHLP